MKKLINVSLAGKSIYTSKGIIKFDSNGVSMLEDEVADAFKSVRGFTVENDAESNEKDKSDKDSKGEEKGAENDSSAAKNDDKTNKVDIDLSALTVPALKKYAKEHGIDVTGLNTKEQLLKAIQK